LEKKVRVQFTVEEVRMIRSLLLEKYLQLRKLPRILQFNPYAYRKYREQQLKPLRRLLKKVHRHGGLPQPWNAPG